MKPIPLAVCVSLTMIFAYACAQPANDPPPAQDAVTDAQSPRAVPATRPEQQINEHDKSPVFAAPNAEPSSTVLKQQPDEGQIKGFDFYRDPLNAKKPMQTFEETMQQDIADKPKVMDAQKRKQTGKG